MEERIQNFILDFASILYEALPFIVLGALLAGVLEEMLPQRLVARFLPKSRLTAILIGGVLGLIFPMCECGIVPVMRRLLRKGFPLSCCVAYLLAGPIINFVVIGSTMFAFSLEASVGEQIKRLTGTEPINNWWMTGLRLGMGYLVAVVTALIVDGLHRKHGDTLLTPLARPSGVGDHDDDDKQKSSIFKRLSNISETSLHDFIDITAFLILGALLSAGLRQYMDPETIAQFTRQHIVFAILIMMGLAVLLCLCSEADAFFAASFSTMQPSAKLAFLVLGPMMDLKLIMLHTRVFRPRLIITIFSSVLIQVFIYSLIFHYIWNNPSWFLGTKPAS